MCPPGQPRQKTPLWPPQQSKPNHLSPVKAPRIATGSSWRPARRLLLHRQVPHLPPHPPPANVPIPRADVAADVQRDRALFITLAPARDLCFLASVSIRAWRTLRAAQGAASAPLGEASHSPMPA